MTIVPCSFGIVPMEFFFATYKLGRKLKVGVNFNK